jgi:hypothetical protein
MHGTHQNNSVVLLFAVTAYGISLECMVLFNCYVSLTTLHIVCQGLFNVACMDVRYKLTIYIYIYKKCSGARRSVVG